VNFISQTTDALMLRCYSVSIYNTYNQSLSHTNRPITVHYKAK